MPRGAEQTSAESGFDGTGTMASKTVGPNTEHLVWDPTASPSLLLSDEGDSYVYGPGGLPIEQISSEEVPTYLHHDQLGSTRLLTDSSGEATGTFAYGAYGALTGQTGTSRTDLGYAGQFTLGQSGLVYLRARFYDPGTGQFMTRDPLQALTREPYVYVGDDPVARIDPSGLISVSGVLGTIGEFLEPLNPIKYYEEEIEAWESGCGYWDSISHGLEGAVVGASDATGIAGLAQGIAGVVARDAAEAGIAGFTSHGLEQVLARDGVGVADEALIDAVSNPVEVVQQTNGTVRYVGANAEVVLNENMEVVTAWATSRTGWRVQP